MLWRYRPTQDSLGLVGVLACSLSYALLLSVVFWHAQWLILLTPFSALAIGYLRRPAALLVTESIAFVAYVAYVSNIWVSAIDTTMVQFGPLRSLIPAPKLLLTDFYPAQSNPVTSIIITVSFFAPLFLVILDRLPGSTAVTGDGEAPLVAPGYWWMRVLTLPIAFTLLVGVAVFIPKSAAVAIDPRAATAGTTPVHLCTSQDVAFGELSDGHALVQRFTADRDDLAVIGFSVATYARTAVGTMHIAVEDARARVLGTRDVDMSTLTDNGIVYIDIRNLAHSAGRTYSISVTTTGTRAGQGVAIWGRSVDCVDGTLTFDGLEKQGDLAATLYFAER